MKKSIFELTNEELTDFIVELCEKFGVTEDELKTKAITAWVMEAVVLGTMVQLLYKNQIEISDVDSTGDLRFAPTKVTKIPSFEEEDYQVDCPDLFDMVNRNKTTHCFDDYSSPIWQEISEIIEQKENKN